jgi:acylphosphatase
MRKFLQQIDKGPRMAHVAKIEKKELEPHERDDSFVVLRTGESMFHSGS